LLLLSQRELVEGQCLGNFSQQLESPPTCGDMWLIGFNGDDGYLGRRGTGVVKDIVDGFQPCHCVVE